MTDTCSPLTDLLDKLERVAMEYGHECPDPDDLRKIGETKEAIVTLFAEQKGAISDANAEVEHWRRMTAKARGRLDAIAAGPEDDYPEGETPTDARVLREANHALAIERDAAMTYAEAVTAPAAELLALYDWRPEIAKLEAELKNDGTDGQDKVKAVRKMLREYGERKKAGWIALRAALANRRTEIGTGSNDQRRPAAIQQGGNGVPLSDSSGLRGSDAKSEAPSEGVSGATNPVLAVVPGYEAANEVVRRMRRAIHLFHNAEERWGMEMIADFEDGAPKDMTIMEWIEAAAYPVHSQVPKQEADRG